MEPGNEIFLQTLDRLFIPEVSSYLKSLYNNIQELENLGIIEIKDDKFIDVLNDLCVTDDYRDSELQFIIRDILFKESIKLLHDNGLSLVDDEEYIDLKSISMVVNAIVLYLNDENGKLLPREEEGDNLYEAMASLIAMYSEFNIVQARDLLNDVNLTFCNNLNLCISMANLIDDNDDYRLEIVNNAVAKDPVIAGTKIINDLAIGNLQELFLNFKDDQKTILKYINKCETMESSVMELVAYLYLLGATKLNYYQMVEDNLNFQSINFISNSNDKKFEFLKLLEGRIK